MSTYTQTQEEETLLPISRLFNTPTSKVVDFLLTNQDFDYSESDISRITGVSGRTIQRIVPSLLAEKIIKRTRKSGKAYMYEADLDSKRTTALLAYINATRDETLQQKFSQ